MSIRRRVFSTTPSTTRQPFCFVPVSSLIPPIITQIVVNRFTTECFSNSETTSIPKEGSNIHEYTIEFCCREMSFRCLLIVTVLIILCLQSNALSPFYSFRHLYDQSDVSPSPSPSYVLNLASGGLDFQQSCSQASGSCQLKNITACLTHSQEEIWLYIHNNDGNPEHVKIMILPTKNVIKELNITSQEIKKVNISSLVDFSSAIALTTSNGDCVITPAAAQPPENRHQKPSSYRIYITPINGAYLGILVLIIGGSLTFIKLRTRVRHVEGARYHELEMGNPTDLNTDGDETENWDQSWDDQWDDEKLKSGGDNLVLVKIR